MLATALGVTIHAVDSHQPFLGELRRRAEDAGVGSRIQAHCMEMSDSRLLFNRSALVGGGRLQYRLRRRACAVGAGTAIWRLRRRQRTRLAERSGSGRRPRLLPRRLSRHEADHRKHQARARSGLSYVGHA
ncbi:hypothetical protein [Sinorhizobium fredii]|uniref:hypothetical protein n=1 Tax=Rhizobium fredii TaxID=380 RepID=UPI00351781ED